MARPRGATEEQQRAEDCAERRELAEKINGAFGRIAIAEKRIADAKAAHAKALNALRSELGTAEREHRDALGTYERLRLRMVALLPEPCSEFVAPDENEPSPGAGPFTGFQATAGTAE